MTFVGFPDTGLTNPPFTKEDYLLYAPQFETFVGGDKGSQLYDKYFDIAKEKILIGVYFEDWEVAMSLCISHYISLSNVDREQSYGLHEQALDSRIKGDVTTGRTGKNIDVSYDYTRITVESVHGKFWNQTKYGQRLFNLLQNKKVGIFGVAV